MLVAIVMLLSCKRSWMLSFMVQVQPAEIGVGPCNHYVGCINPCCMCWLLRQDQQFSNVLPCSSPLLHIASLLCLPPHQLLLQPLSLSVSHPLTQSLTVPPLHLLIERKGGVTPTQIVVNGKCVFMQYTPFFASGDRDFCGNNSGFNWLSGIENI